MIDKLTVALWAANMALQLDGPEAFLALAERQLARARSAGAQLVVMPEHLSEGWLGWAPRGLPETAEIAWLAEEARTILPRLVASAERYGLALLAGTVPVAVGPGRFRNRAHLRLPDGTMFVQDKLTLTPDERDPAAWMFEPGERLVVVPWNGIRIVTLVCLDVEQPGLAARLKEDPPDLVLVPTDTGAISGYSRVTACARARAVELCTAVAVAGGVGTVPVPPDRPNVSGAALFVPCEMALGGTGVWAELGPLSETRGDGPLLIARDVPIRELRRLRAGAAEVWPGFHSLPHETVALGPATPSNETVEHEAAQETIG
ncbi:MAG: amidohydrolase [Geminicoccaceae bacterium]|nr:MAG: amidohydrolase [Geminicoccaceae bacterium]